MIKMTVMRTVHVASLDLNLLRVLDALFRERHLTRAAKALGLSQPAASHALARLREHFDDPLFVRTSEGLVPTPGAAALEGKLRAAMRALEESVTGARAFDPATARTTFTLATADYGSFVVVPPLLERLRREAAGTELWVRSVRDDVFTDLARGECDVYLGPVAVGATARGIHTRRLLEEHFVCVVRRDHPRVAEALDLDTYASLPHVFVAPRGTPGGVVDVALAKHRRKRHIAVAVPQFLLAPHLVAHSDMVLTIGRRVAEAFAAMLPLRVLAPPLALPPFAMDLAWHDRTHADPAHAWFRDEIVEAAPKETATPAPKTKGSRGARPR